MKRSRPPAAAVSHNGGRFSSSSAVGFGGGAWYPSGRTPRGPDGRSASMFSASSGGGGMAATASDVLGLPAFNRGKNLIGGIIGQMPLVDRMADGTAWPENPALADPWPVMGRAEWITYQTDAMIITGDAMAIPADYDADGFPRQLVPIDPRAVVVYLDSGAVWYDVYTSEGVFTLPRSGIWHAKGLTLTADGLRGVGVLAQFWLALGLGAELLRYGLNAFAGAGVPSGIVKVNLRNVSQTQADGIKADWLGSFRDRVPAVLSQLMDYTPISWSPTDMALLENRRFSVSDIAYILNLDPMDLDATMGGSMTYANRQDQAFDRLFTSIGPYLVRFEQAYRFLIPRGHTPTFDRSVPLWANSATRAQVQDVQLRNGVMTLNEGREQEQRPRFASWADEPFGKPPAPEPPPLPPPPPDSPNPPEPPAPAANEGPSGTPT